MKGLSFPRDRANCPMTARGPPNDDARQQQRGLMVVGRTRVSRDGDDLMRTKVKTKKKARTSNKKPKKSLDQKLTGPKNPNLKKKSKTDISDITRKIKSLEIEDHDCRASGG